MMTTMTTSATGTGVTHNIRELTRDDIQRVVAGIPTDVQDVMSIRGLILAGGSVRALVAGEPVSDFDLFGCSEPVQQKAARDLSTRRRILGQTSRMFDTPNALTVLSLGRTPVQFITRWCFQDALSLIASFDFTVAQAAVWRDERGWRSLCLDAFYPDLAARRLTYTRPAREEDACGSLLRVRKFLAKGYTIQASSLSAVVARAVCRIPALGIVLAEDEVATFIEAHVREVDPLQVVDQIEVAADHFAV